MARRWPGISGGVAGRVRRRAAWGLLLGWLLAPGTGWGAPLEPVRLRCEHRENPGDVDEAWPVLRWALRGDGHDRRQRAFQVLVASEAGRLRDGEADLWDSGRRETEDALDVRYAGRPLESGQRCHWMVRVWDERGRVSPWSAPAHWEMALLRAEDWTAAWIGAGPEAEPRPPAGFFKSREEFARSGASVKVDARSVRLRREFDLDRPVRRARLYGVGLGYYELWCNGRRVGDQVLAPAKSQYRLWIDYDVHDVTALLAPGRNALGAELGNGWYNPDPRWWEPYRMPWFGSKRACFQLEVEFVDGTRRRWGTDASWTCAPGPVIASCVYDGEVFDAREEQPGWNRPGFDDRAWRPARIMEAPGGRLVARAMPPIRVVESRTPVALTEPRPGAYVWDLGQNFSGWVRITLRGERGARVVLRYAEDLNSDGTLDPRSNERAAARDEYILRGGGDEVYEPRFTFHGFRYVEVTGLASPPKASDVTGCVVHTDAGPAGRFECDHDLVQRIHRATHWSQRSCLMGYPMDCPQRDERLGWLGDALVTVEEAQLNFDLPAFYARWLDGVRRNQDPVTGDLSIVSPRPYMPEEPDPTWSSAYPLMVWQCYRHYGDRGFLERHFEAVRRFVDYLGTQAAHDVLPRYWIGDWGSIVEGWQEGDPPSVVTAFYYEDTRVVSRMAQVLGLHDVAERYRARADRIRAAFRRAYFDPARREFVPGTLFANAFPLLLGLADPGEEGDVLGRILDGLRRNGGRFDVGVLGAKYLIDALTGAGRPDEAWRLVTQTGYPSWAHLLEGGRTTLSEFWDLHGSHNHAMLGSVDAWFYRVLAGIQSEEANPGFSRVILAPYLAPGLGRVDAEVDTVRGPIGSRWSRTGKGFHWRVRIPPQVRAEVRVPARPVDRIRCSPARTPVRVTAAGPVFELGSGEYDFRIRFDRAPAE